MSTFLPSLSVPLQGLVHGVVRGARAGGAPPPGARRQRLRDRQAPLPEVRPLRRQRPTSHSGGRRLQGRDSIHLEITKILPHLSIFISGRSHR